MVFDFSVFLPSRLSTVFVLLAEHVQLERHPPKIQTIKKWKIKKYVFRLFEIHKDTFPLFDFSFFGFLRLILHTFRLEPCSTSFPSEMLDVARKNVFFQTKQCSSTFGNLSRICSILTQIWHFGRCGIIVTTRSPAATWFWTTHHPTLLKQLSPSNQSYMLLEYDWLHHIWFSRPNYVAMRHDDDMMRTWLTSTI